MHLHDCDFHLRLAGAGTPLVWAHGMLSNMAAEDALLDLWTQVPHGVRLVRFDARGHGLSTATPNAADYTWPSLGRDMLALGQAASPGPVVLGGWSMGCASALYAALAAPQQARGLVLMLPPRFWGLRREQAALYRRGAALGSAWGQRRLGKLLSLDMERNLPAWLLQARPDAARHAAASMCAWSGTMLGALYGGAAGSDLPDAPAFAALAHVPALVIAWADDPMHPLDAARQLHDLLPRSQLVVARNIVEHAALRARIARFIDALA